MSKSLKKVSKSMQYEKKAVLDLIGLSHSKYFIAYF